MTYDAEGYDPHWTREERCRVEALRLLVEAEPTGTHHEVIKAAKDVAAFIAGPEGLVPMPWQQIREIRRLLNAVFERTRVSPYGDPWGDAKADDDGDIEIAVKVSELRAVHEQLRAFEGEPPF